MRIIDLQRRLREIGRIRIGEQVPTQNGGSRPKKLTTFRFTSRDRQVIDQAAALWGGTVEPWAAPDGEQWQVTTTSNELPVIVPPGDMAFSQAYEQWTAGGCHVRCDGRWDHIADKTCHCDPENRTCSIHSRLSVLVPDLRGVGVWRLDTQGYYAAVELSGVVDLCASHAARGVMLPARLRLEQRSVKRPIKGKVTTLRFVVPTLDLDVHPLSLGAAATNGAEAIEGGFAGELPAPSFTPVPEPERALVPTVRDQIAAVDLPAARESRQTPLPATGLKPRTLAQAQGPGGATDREAVDVSHKPADAGRADMDTPPGPVNPEGQSPVDRTVQDVARKATAVFKDVYDAAPRGHKTKAVDRLRHALTYAATKERTASLKDLDATELIKVWARLDDIAAGRITYVADTADDAAGVTFTSPSGKTTTVLWSEIEDQDRRPALGPDGGEP